MKLNVYLAALAAFFAASAASADEAAYSFVNDAQQGLSYILINENLDSFSFHADYGACGDPWRMGYFVYPQGLNGQALHDYVNSFDVNAKVGDARGDIVTLTDLKAGDRIGFFMDRPEGYERDPFNRPYPVCRSWHYDEAWGYGRIVFETAETKYGHFGDDGNWVSDPDPRLKYTHEEWITVGKVNIVASTTPSPAPGGDPAPIFEPAPEIGGGAMPQGAPLPGSLSVLLVGAGFAAMKRLRAKRA